jgi:hypothetical protein
LWITKLKITVIHKKCDLINVNVHNLKNRLWISRKGGRNYEMVEKGYLVGGEPRLGIYLSGLSLFGV